MTDITAAMKIANFFTGFDILARAQFMEGFAGIVPANAKLKSKTSNSALLAFIQETAMEISPSISGWWWHKGEAGLFRPAYKLADRIGAPHGISANDVMQEEFASANDKGSIFYAAGRIAMRGGRWEAGIKSGELKPSDLQGIVKNLASKSMKEAVDTLANRRKLEKEQAALIGEATMGVGGFDFDEWSMIVDAILNQPESSISQEFLGWLKSLIEGMSSGSGKLMNDYLDLILSGQAKDDREVADMLGLANTAYLGRIKKEFSDRASELLAESKGGPKVQRIRDLLSDASFLNQLLKGRVPGSRTAKLIAKAQKLASLRKAATVRLLSASDYAVLLDGRQAKFPAGKSMTIDEVAEVVGPEFKEMNENPPESVKKVMEEMSKKARLLSASDYRAELEKASKFEKGKPADPTENMSEEDAAEWERQNELNKDQFKTAAGRRLSWPDGDRSAPWTPWGPAQYGTEIMRGVRVYGTAGHGGMAVAQGIARKMLTPAALKMAEFANGYYWFEEDAEIEIPLYERPEWFYKMNNRDMSDQEKGRMESSMRRYFPRYFSMLEQGVQLPTKLTPGMVLSVLKPLSFGKNQYNMNVGDMVRVVEIRSQNIVVDFGGMLFRIPMSYYTQDDPYLALSAKTASGKTAATASGLYGFTKSAEKSCTGAAMRLGKFAAKLAKELYTKDADTAPFMEEHAKRGSKAAKMLRQEMSNVGPGAAPKTAASKSGNGLYGFKEKTAKLAMDACSELQMEAGRQAADIAAKFGEKHATGADFLKKHAKAAKCGFSDLILDSYPASPVKVAEKSSAAKQANHLADSYLAEGELMAGRTWDGDKSTPDDSVPYNKHPESPPAGADGSPQRANYNRWFRENVCPDHATNCGMGRQASFDPTVDEILAWDRSLGGRSAASFLASDEMADDELLMDGDEVMAGRTWGGPNYRPKPVDDSIPYNKHPESPPAGANGSAERRRYNRWFRENVCPDHATNCGL